MDTFQNHVAQFRKLHESTRAQQAALAGVEACSERIQPITAVSCGVVPLPVEPPAGLGNDVAYFAGGPSVPEAVYDLLGVALGCRVVSAPFDEQSILQTIERVYLGNGDLNLPTFESPDFLADPASAPIILEEKVEPLPESWNRSDPEQLVFLDLSLRSRLENLDRDEPVDIKPGAADLAFKMVNGLPVLFLDEELDSDVALVVQRSFFHDGAEHVKSMGGALVRSLPLRVHPTEIQLVGIEADGSVVFHLYDRRDTVRPGETAEFQVSYYYLRYGMRYRRQLDLNVHGVWQVPRSHVTRGTTDDWVGPEDLERLFGLDFDA